MSECYGIPVYPNFVLVGVDCNYEYLFKFQTWFNWQVSIVPLRIQSLFEGEFKHFQHLNGIPKPVKIS